MAAVCLPNFQRRLFYLAPDNVIHEYAQDGESTGWRETDFHKKGYKAYAASRLTAVSTPFDALDPNWTIWLYYQGPSGDTRQIAYAYDSRSTDGTGYALSVPGSGLGSLYFHDNTSDHLRIYFQHSPSNGRIGESGYDGGPWNTNNLIPTISNPAPNTQIAATSFSSFQGRRFTVWFLQNDYTVGQYFNNGNGTWALSRVSNDMAAYGSGIVLTSLRPANGVRAYIQAVDNSIQEYVSADGQTWTKGSIVPTGPTD